MVLVPVKVWGRCTQGLGLKHQSLIDGEGDDSGRGLDPVRGYVHPRHVQDKSVADCKRHLNKLCEYGNVVRLNWIPGHADQKGNEVTDRLVKRGADMVTSGVTPVIPVSKCVITNAGNMYVVRALSVFQFNHCD